MKLKQPTIKILKVAGFILASAILGTIASKVFPSTSRETFSIFFNLVLVAFREVWVQGIENTSGELLK